MVNGCDFLLVFKQYNDKLVTIKKNTDLVESFWDDCSYTSYML